MRGNFLTSYKPVSFSRTLLHGVSKYIQYRCNNCKFYKEMELTRKFRFKRMQWMGHVMGMKEERVPKKALIE
jgi:hypothetical protein